MAWTLDLLKRLSDGGIDFVIIGGVAAITHGSARITEDLDICASLDQENAMRIIQVLADVHPRWRMRPDLPVITPDSHNLRGLKNMYLRTDLGQLDVLGELPGVCSLGELSNKTIEVTFRGIRCRVLDLDTLIAAKRYAGREKDKPAIRELETIRQMLQQRPSHDQP